MKVADKYLTQTSHLKLKSEQIFTVFNENSLSLNLTRSGTKILLRKIKCRRVQIVF